MSLHHLSLTDLATRLRRGELSSIEVTEAQLRRIADHDETLRSFVVVTGERALADAARADRELAAGIDRGPLHGVPVGVKDVFWTADAPAAGGTTIFAGFRPPEDATAVARLREAGAVLLGKQQMTEGAYSDHHPSVTPPVNPWRADLWPGISSSGPAVATAAGLGYGALASDTGGSIRWPSAANGLTGIKPTWGRVSRHGSFALAPSLDHVGPIARTAADAAAMLAVVAGRDARDATSLSVAPPAGDAALSPGLRVGIDARWCADDVGAGVQRVLDDVAGTFAALGARLVSVRAPDIHQAVRDWTPLCAVEAAVVHRETFPSRRDEYGPVLAGVLDSGARVSAPEVIRILERRRALCGDLASMWRDVDLLLTPVHPFAPLTVDDVAVLGERPELVERLQRFTAPFDMTGSPTITLPAGTDDAGMPIAVQLVAPDLAEARLIAAGVAFQSVTGWHRRHPDVSRS